VCVFDSLCQHVLACVICESVLVRVCIDGRASLCVSVLYPKRVGVCLCLCVREGEGGDKVKVLKSSVGTKYIRPVCI
jgi:hypothetical protein